MAQDVGDSNRWSTASSQYANVLQAMTSQGATKLVEEVSSIIPFTTASTRVLDDGSGTGSVTHAIHAHSPNTPVLATDLSPGMLEQLAAYNLPNVRTKVADALDLSSLGPDGKDGLYSHVLSTFMIQFTPDATKAVREIHRVLQSSGVLGLGSWGQHDFAVLLNRVARQLDPAWTDIFPYRMEWPADEDGVRARLGEIGFVDVKVWTMFLPMAMSQEATLEYVFAGLNPGAEDILRPWRENGRFEEFSRLVKKIASEEMKDKPHVSRAIMATARKA